MPRQLTVLKHISGSRLVILRNLEHYIDVRYGRHDNFDEVECVRRGRVYRRECIATWHDDCADRLLKIIKEELL